MEEKEKLMAFSLIYHSLTWGHIKFSLFITGNSSGSSYEIIVIM